MLDDKRLQEIKTRLEKYKEWAKDMPIGELISHKPAYKYIARDYCADVDELITALEKMTEAHRLDLEMILEFKAKVPELEADCAIALRQMRISDEGNKKLQAERDDIQADNLKALELIVEGQTAEIELITKLDISQARLAEWESGARVTEDRLKLAAELQAECERLRKVAKEDAKQRIYYP